MVVATMVRGAGLGTAGAFFVSSCGCSGGGIYVTHCGDDNDSRKCRGHGSHRPLGTRTGSCAHACKRRTCT